MKSIRARLTTWLLSGLAVLFFIAGFGTYTAVRQSLLKSIDAELAVDARLVRFAARGNDSASTTSPRGTASKRLQDRMPAYDVAGSDVFFQVWNADGKSIEKSVSLGEQEFNFPSTKLGGEAVFLNTTLGDGRKIRTMSIRNGPGGKGKGNKGKGGARSPDGTTILVLGKETKVIERTLSYLLGGMALAGIIAALSAIVLVKVALRYGLKPLDELGKQTATINADALDSRFDDAKAPSELEPVYQHLNDLIQRLENSFDRERQFSSDLAHEMRTPLAELKMLNEVAIKWPEESSARVHSDSVEVCEQLENVIENILSLARLESGDLQLASSPVEIDKFLRRCWEPFEMLATEKNLSVNFDFDSGLIFHTDEKMLFHVFNNLFSNAVEYCPENGQIVIIGTKNEVIISNTSHDLSDEDISKLFDRHWRSDQSRNSRSHAGLGLPLAKAVAEALGLSLCARLNGANVEFRVSKSTMNLSENYVLGRKVGLDGGGHKNASTNHF